MEYVIQSGDTPSKLALRYTSKEGRWPEFCKANPKFPAHASYGCVFYPGNKATIPDSWITTAPVPSPVPGPVPSPIGPPIPTTDTAPTPEPSPGLFAGLDTTKVVAGGVALAALVVVVYAMKKKGRSTAAA